MKRWVDRQYLLTLMGMLGWCHQLLGLIPQLADHRLRCSDQQVYGRPVLDLWLPQDSAS